MLGSDHIDVTAQSVLKGLIRNMYVILYPEYSLNRQACHPAHCYEDCPVRLQYSEVHTAGSWL